MITKKRAEEIKKAWLQFHGWESETRTFEMHCFIQGMRAVAHEYARHRRHDASLDGELHYTYAIPIDQRPESEKEFLAGGDRFPWA